MGYDLQMIVEPKFQLTPGSYNTSGSGIDLLANIMDLAGVLDDSPVPTLEVAWPPPGMSAERAEKVYWYLNGSAAPNPPASAAEFAACGNYKTARDRWAQTRSPQADKVPGFKFQSNDNWLVTPEECSLIAAALDKLLADPPKNLGETIGFEGDAEELMELVEDWRDYNFVASTHGGYTVG